MSSPGFVDSAWNSAEDVLDDILKHAEYCADWPDYKSAPMPASLVSYYDGANAGSSSSSGAATYQKEKDCSESEKCDKGKEWFSENGGNGSGGTSGDAFNRAQRPMPEGKETRKRRHFQKPKKTKVVVMHG